MLYCGDAMWPHGKAIKWQLPFISLILLLLANIALPDRFVRQCHPNYYMWPMCINHADGYGCECGPGFFWNTKMCIALGLDSRFEFAQRVPASYALLLGKTFPQLRSFTLGMWMKTFRPYFNGTVISYKVPGQYNIIRLVPGPTVKLYIHKDMLDTGITPNATTWFYFTWTWTSDDGTWEMYIDGRRLKHGIARATAGKKIPGGGELVLGQASRTMEKHNIFNLEDGYRGEMSSVNIWSRVLSEREIRQIVRDCYFMTCGDAVEWADFRSGTRGELRIRWPSGIRLLSNHADGSCFSATESDVSCDEYCSQTIGAQCRNEIAENIVWQRTPANSTASVACPGHNFQEGDTIVYANRTCYHMSEYDGVWGDPVLDDCISENQLKIKQNIHSLMESDSLNTSQVLILAEKLLNGTADEQYRNPVDIATVIDSVDRLIKSPNPMRYVRTHPEDELLLHDTESFASSIVGILDQLTYDRNLAGWLATLPPGSEGDRLLRVIEDFLVAVYIYLHAATSRGELSLHQAVMSTTKLRLGFQTKLYNINTVELPEIRFPDRSQDVGIRQDELLGSVVIPHGALSGNNETGLSESGILGISIGRFLASHILPNHDLLTKSKEDNVNSAFVMVLLHTNVSINFTHPLTLHFPYYNNFNISNPECVHLIHGNRSSWHWSRDACRLRRNTSSYAVCDCWQPGIYAITTDMYNVDWDRGDDPIPLMRLPSYIGCALSALLCLVSCLMLIYLRTSSKTAAIHKNFAVAIVCSQLTFMIGIDKIAFKVVCRAFAVSFHYFFLAMFSWLMNEAFNLYIVITYAAHAHDDAHEGGSQWRWYVLGWVLPGIMVGAFVGTHTDDYYAPDACWIAWQYIWLFLGPAIGIISVTILVLIFTAKEHHETAYAKNEQTNKMISIHSKALWTQAILLTICWSFAFLTLKMRGIIIKVLYALFNTLQGAFFLVFYFLLNDEVRAVLSIRRKRKSLAKHGYDYSSAQSEESLNVNSDAEDSRPRDENHIELMDQTPSSNNQKRTHKRRKNKSQIEVSSDEASDCEMMITSV